jgi:succinate dehydrogenase flavin-adding protein (antitoxin of CptAB toxin-antitoxin module)
MKIPKPTFVKIIEECNSPKKSRICLVLNNRLYTVDGKKNVKNNLFYFINNHYSLNESETLRFLEQIYFKDNEEVIKSCIDEIADKKLDNKSKYIKNKIKNLNNEKYELVKFTVENIFPFDNNKENKNKENNKIKSKKVKKILFERDNINNHFIKDYFKNFINRKKSSLESILDNKDIMIFNNNVYNLKKTSKSIYEQIKNKVKIKNSFYSYNFLSCFKDLERNYLESIHNEIKQAANYSKKLKNNISLSKEEKLLDIAKRTNYEKNKLGFLVIEKSNKLEKFYIYIKVNPFVLKSPENGHYYKFEKCKVGVNLELRRNEVEFDKPVIIDKYSHPLIPNKNQPEQCICYGSASQRKQIKEDLDKFNGTGKKINYFLKAIGEPVVTGGYYGDMSPHFKLTDENFGNQLITLEEIKKQGLSITN